MPKRKLRIVRKSPPPIIGVCEHCNAQFRSDKIIGVEDVKAQFKVHRCRAMDSSQNALRIVREATDGK